MSKHIQSVRGMRDLLPEQSYAWQQLESLLNRTMTQYGYAEIRTPIVEKTELFCRSIGEVTDIVEKEMYSFEDRNGDGLTLRPENTAACVRAVLQNGLLRDGPLRLFYMGPMFRHERPQKGRYRQFHQVGAEAYGMPGPVVEAELIGLGERLWKVLGIDADIELEINTLGVAGDRQKHREALIAYFEANLEVLDEDAKRRLHSNPLRILDTKNPDMQALVEAAPQLSDYLCEESQQHFTRLKSLLDELGITYRVNPRLVRGLDYYSHTVFEWVTTRLGSQGTVCAGGRYDGLVDDLGGKATPAVGWAMGMERLLELVAELHGQESAPSADLYVVMAGERAECAGLALAEQLRTALPGRVVLSHCSGGSFKSQFKRADKSGARYALIIGDNEAESKTVAVKPLRGDGDQQVMAQAELVSWLESQWQ